jgi:GntR family transcriptional regulator
MARAQDQHKAHRGDFRAIAQGLRDAITRGDYQPGDKLPSERVLANQHQAARNTAREAIAQLRREGLVTAEHGRGVFVRQKPRWMRFGRHRYSAAMRATNELGPFGSEAAAQGKTPHVEVPSIIRTTAPDHVAERLGIEPGTEVVRRENWYYADDEPVQIGVTFAPWAIVEGTPVADSADMGPGGIYSQFDDCGHVITYIREEITSRMPSSEEAEQLQVPDGVPVIDLWHTGIDANRQPFECTNFVMRADVTALDYDMRVED